MKILNLTPLALVLSTSLAVAGSNQAIDQENAVISASDVSKIASFDILAAHVHSKGHLATFQMTTHGAAGAETPKPVGTLAGASVYGYVWPLSLDPSTVGFEGGTGILALAATNHPDFDDTPLYDENDDGDLTNDGGKWHSHWVVLTPTESCGKDALAVRDIPKGEKPNLPATWPGLPIFIDSPGYTPQLNGSEIKVVVPFASPEVAKGASYDGVTAAMRVNANIHAPLLCVTGIFDVASGDLSLPGKIE